MLYLRSAGRRADELDVNELLNVPCEVFVFELRHFTKVMERQRRRRVEWQKNSHQVQTHRHKVLTTQVVELHLACHR